MTAFLAGEGDRWFERNRPATETYDPDGDPLVRLVTLAGRVPTAVIEVGASAGYRVAALVERWGCRGVAVDPSEAAVAAGRRRFPQVAFAVGTMDRVPVDDAFDLVIVNFVFHWVARSVLLASMAEVDRLVADGGYLAIGDFLPFGQVRTPYRHQADLWTYKQDYGEVFCSSGLYCRLATVTGEHGGPVPSGEVDPMHRVAYSLLHKSLDGHYQALSLD